MVHTSASVFSQWNVLALYFFLIRFKWHQKKDSW
jgi:hypothetical protein